MSTTAPPLRIVTDVPAAGWPSRAGRGAVLLAGYLLVLAGLIAAVPTLAFAVLAPIAAVTGEEVTTTAWAWLVAAVVGTAFLLWSGLRLVRGRRHLVLFLRRFGFDDASEALTSAVHAAIGGRWRLVTLDDSAIRPVGVRRSSRVAWGFGRWLVTGLLAAVVAGGAYWWFSGGLDAFVDELVGSAFTNAQEGSDDPVAGIVGGIVAAIALTAIALAFLFAVVIGLVSALGVATVGLWRGDRALQQAEGAKALVLARPAEVAPAVARIRGHAGRTFAPRLVVVRVHDAIWRDVVHELARDASVTLVDVSQPTEHLVWEVTLLQEQVRASTVFVGRRDLVEAMARATGDGPAVRLRDLLAGSEVLAYDARDTRRFARSLAAALDRADG